MLTAMIPKAARKRIRRWMHRGSTYRCPLCGYRCRGFRVDGHDLPVLQERQVVGAGPRPIHCYGCGSGDRARLVYVYLRDALGFERASTMSVLHIAPEKMLRERLSEIGFQRYVCGDLRADGYSYPSWVQRIDATNIKFDDDTFDLVICNHVLEHIPDDATAMRELCRVLKPGGTAVLQVPISANTQETIEDPTVVDDAERERRFGQWDHVRLYGQDYDDRLAAAGFVVDRVDVTDRYAECGVNPDEELFICTK